PAARNITGTVVTSNSSMIRGFVKATYAQRTAAADWRLPAHRSPAARRAVGTTAASDRTGEGWPRREVDTTDTGTPKAEIGRRRTPTVSPLRDPRAGKPTVAAPHLQPRSRPPQGEGRPAAPCRRFADQAASRLRAVGADRTMLGSFWGSACRVPTT